MRITRTEGRLMSCAEILAQEGWKPLTEVDLAKKSEAFRRGYYGRPEHEEPKGDGPSPQEAA